MIRDVVQSGKGYPENQVTGETLQLPVTTQSELTGDNQSRQSRIEGVRRAFLAKGVSLDQVVLDQKNFGALGSILDKVGFSREDIDTFFQGMVENHPEGKISLSDFFKEITQFEDEFVSSQEKAVQAPTLDKSLIPELESVLRGLGVTPETLDSLLPSVVDADGNVDLEKLVHQLKEIQSTSVSSGELKTGQDNDPVLTSQLMESMEKMNLTSPRQSIGASFSLDDLIGIIETTLNNGTGHAQASNGQETVLGGTEVLDDISDISGEQANGEDYVDTFFAFAREMMVLHNFEKNYRTESSNTLTRPENTRDAITGGIVSQAVSEMADDVILVESDTQASPIDAKGRGTGVDQSQSNGQAGQAVEDANQSQSVSFVREDITVQDVVVAATDRGAASVVNQTSTKGADVGNFVIQSNTSGVQPNGAMDTAGSRSVPPDITAVRDKDQVGRIDKQMATRFGVGSPQPDGRLGQSGKVAGQSQEAASTGVNGAAASKIPREDVSVKGAVVAATDRETASVDNQTSFRGGDVGSSVTQSSTSGVQSNGGMDTADGRSVSSGIAATRDKDQPGRIDTQMATGSGVAPPHPDGRFGQGGKVAGQSQEAAFTGVNGAAASEIPREDVSARETVTADTDRGAASVVNQTSTKGADVGNFVAQFKTSGVQSNGGMGIAETGDVQLDTPRNAAGLRGVSSDTSGGQTDTGEAQRHDGLFPAGGRSARDAHTDVPGQGRDQGDSRSVPSDMAATRDKDQPSRIGTQMATGSGVAPPHPDGRSGQSGRVAGQSQEAAFTGVNGAAASGIPREDVSAQETVVAITDRGVTSVVNQTSFRGTDVENFATQSSVNQDLFQGERTDKANKRGLRNTFSLPWGKTDTAGMGAQIITAVNNSSIEGDKSLSKEIHLLIDDILEGARNNRETLEQPGIHKAFYSDGSGASERFPIMGRESTNTTYSFAQGEQVSDTRWPPNVVETVGKEIAAFLQRGDRILKLQLKPAELGIVNIEMDTKDNVVKLSIVAESSSAKELFLANHNDLRRVLEGHGVKLESLDVQMNNSFDQSLANGDHHSARQNQRWGSQLTRMGTVDDGEMQHHQPIRMNRDTLLDLMV